MSVIYGIVMLNDQPINQEVLKNMKNAIEFTGPDTEGIWQNEHAAIGSLTKFDTPESFKEKQPIFFEDKQKVMVVAARIDNRDDLCRVFNIPLIYRDNYPDSHYIKLAYEKWGDSCPDHLLGDWSFAVYDKVLQKLFVARDHCGIMALYYYSCPDFFAFSSSPKGLLALKEIPKELNEFRLAQILVAWPGDGEQTCYLNIYNLLPGCYLTIENKKVQKTKYWELKEQDDLILPKEQDYYDQFLEIFTEAVKCRLRTTKQVGISLSGGLDSTSIAAIAAIELAKQNKELFAFTSVPLYKDYKISKHRNGDEGELAGLMAKMYPNIRHYLVNAEGYDPIECIKKAVDIHDEPMHAAANQYWIQAINDKAKEFDVNILLTGQGGNGVISWPTGKVKLQNQRGIRYFKNHFRLAFDDVYYFLFNKKLHKYPFLKYSDINLEFAEKLGLIKKMKDAGHDPKFNQILPLKREQRKLINRCFNNAYPLNYKTSLLNKINSSDPTGDKLLIEYSLAVPKWFYRKHDYDRILITKGMKNFICPKVLNSQYKGIQGSDKVNRLQKSNIYMNEMDVIKDFINVSAFERTNPVKFCRRISLLYFIKTFENKLNI